MPTMKLRLDLDQLRIDSFDTQPARESRRGTIAGHELDDTSTFDLGKVSNFCTVACPGGTLACEPVDPNDKYRLPDLNDYDYD